MLARALELRRALRVGLTAGTLIAGGCALPPRIEVPPALPNTPHEQVLTLRWALVRDGGAVRAVGLAASSLGSRWDATVALEGLDGTGRAVSRRSGVIRPGFGPGPTAFEVTLVPTGGEREYRLRVVRLQEFARPGR
jgi:hypothetical protein